MYQSISCDDVDCFARAVSLNKEMDRAVPIFSCCCCHESILSNLPGGRKAPPFRSGNTHPCPWCFPSDSKAITEPTIIEPPQMTWKRTCIQTLPKLKNNPVSGMNNSSVPVMMIRPPIRFFCAGDIFFTAGKLAILRLRKSHIVFISCFCHQRKAPMSQVMKATTR